MTRKTFIVLSAAAAMAATSAVATGQVVQLRDGQILVGKVQDPHEGGLTFRRLDNGGVLELSWEQLSSESAGKIKALAGLSTAEEGELLVPAVAVTFETPGGTREKVVGRIIEEGERHITLRRQGISYPIERARIKARPEVEVPATEVYTRDEFYHEKLQEIAPGDDADRHLMLADELLRVRDYDHAEQHLLRARELGNSRQPNLLEGKIKRLQRFQEAAAERELLDAVDVAMARKQFERGRELLARYEERFGDGKLRTDFEQLRQRFDKARERHLVDRMAKLWTDAITTLAKSKALEPVGFDAAKDYALDRMGEDIRERVARSLHLDPEEVDPIWSRRLDYRGLVRAHDYHYGVGSWTLGEQAIVEGTRQAEVATETASKQDREVQRALERIRRAQERARRALQRSGGERGEEEVTPQDWWQDASHNERYGFLRAYYAEQSGDLQVEDAHINDCLTCAGAGKLTFEPTQGESTRVDCPTCHGTRFKRWFRAR